MKTIALLIMTMIAGAALSGCGSATGAVATTPASTVKPPPPAAVTGVSTPKSVSVVTAN
jgi:uncharacterized protein YceK